MYARKKLTAAGALFAALGSALAFAAADSPAHAEPKQYDAGILMGFGSDTTQEVTNALAGYSNGTAYAPILAKTVTGAGKDVFTQLASWDAINPETGNKNDCITTKLNGPLINRPNGSGGGRGMLSVRYGAGQQIGTTGNLVQNRWGTSAATNASCTNKLASPLIDFARSSSTGGSSLNGSGPLAYVPFAQDALGFAYYDAANVLGGAAPTLTVAQLNELFRNGPNKFGGSTLFLPCDIQSSSGTRADFIGKLGSPAPTAINIANATEACRYADTADDFDVLPANEGGTSWDGQVEENKGISLQNKGTAVNAGGYSHVDCDGNGIVDDSAAVSCAGAIVVIGHSVSAFVAKSNNVAPNTVGLAKLGKVDFAGSDPAPYTGTTTLVANPVYYATSMGRSVYYVVPTAVLNGAGNNALKAMFTNGSYPNGNTDAAGTGGNVDGNAQAEICETAAQTIAQAFGYVKLSDIAGAEVCGSVTRQGPWDGSQPS